MYKRKVSICLTEIIEKLSLLIKFQILEVLFIFLDAFWISTLYFLPLESFFFPYTHIQLFSLLCRSLEIVIIWENR